MILFPAIDLLEGSAVRLFKGDYEQKTVYHTDPVFVAKEFERSGARFAHLVDLDGAKSGGTPNLSVIESILRETSLSATVGGGIRSMETAEKYFCAGAARVVLGTAAVKDEAFLKSAVREYGERIVVGVDLKDNKVAIRGWTETVDTDAFSFCKRMQEIGVSALICTDISRDGAMRGTNLALYRELSERFSMRIIASGGVSAMEDIGELKRIGLYGAIVGKAYYSGAIDLKKALEAAK